VAESSNVLMRRPQGSQALARVEVEQDVIFIPEWSRWSWLAGLPLVLAAGWSGWLGLAVMIVPGIPHRRARRLLRKAIDPSRRRPPEEILASLRQLASRRWLPSSVRADVAGWLALGLLEQGELQPALEALRGPVFARRWRPRGAVAGMFGEGIRAIIERLFPEAGWPVVPSDALVDDPRSMPGQLQLVVLRAVLRLLEAIDTGDPGLVATRWAELPRAPLAPLPVLMTLLQAEAARVQPALGVDLDARIRALTPAGRRLVLQRPAALGDDGPQGYRMPARMPAEPSTSLAVPERLAAIRILGFGGREGLTMIVAAWVGAVLVGWPGFLGMMIGWYGLSKLTAFPRVLKRRDRMQPLANFDLHPAWLRELSHMRTRSHSRRKWAADLAPFDRDHVMLVLGVHRAEQALLTQDHQVARDSIGWWLGNLSPRGLHELDPVGLGAALLRLAGLLGFDDALTLLDRIPPRARRGVPRSGHGDAPRAMGLARALVEAHRERWDAAAQHVREAMGHPRVTWDPVDLSFYDWLIEGLATRGRGHPHHRLALDVPKLRPS
jgi:hypothetical protein